MSAPFIEPVKHCTTPAEMRAELSRLRRYNYLIEQCLRSAEHSGLSAEDKYSVLAYALAGVLFATQERLSEAMHAVPPLPTCIVLTDCADLEGRN
jgi:hypothetical protein